MRSIIFKTTKIKHLIIVALICSFSRYSSQIQAQPLSNSSQLSENFALFNYLHPAGSLFLHFDKNVYLKNESIWFSGYLVDADSINLSIEKVMSVVLANERKEIFGQFKYIMQSGITKGSFKIPDSIPPGRYKIFAYLDDLDRKLAPIYQFSQNITIKALNPNLLVTLTRQETSPADKKATTYLIKVVPSLGTSEQKLQSIPVSYSISGLITKEKLNKNGELVIKIPLELQEAPRKLVVDVGQNPVIQHLEVALPVATGLETVNIYPEGGNLAEGLINQVAMEVKNKEGGSVENTYYLYENTNLIDSIITDKQGTASFWLMPKSGLQYGIRKKSENGAKTALPFAKSNGIALHLKDGVVEDTLNVKLSSILSGRFRIILHNFKNLFADIPVMVDKKGMLVKIDVKALPRGLASITLLNDRNDPVAERLVFIHYNSCTLTDISINKKLYGKREKVTVKIKLSSPGGSLSGISSLACVREDRLNIDDSQDIQTFTYIDNELGKTGYRFHDSILGKKNLERLLLIKGWRRYKWKYISNVKPPDTIGAFEKATINGVVKSFNKTISKPGILRIAGINSNEIVTTDSKGVFKLTPDFFKSQYSTRYTLAAYGIPGASIMVDDQFHKINKIIVDDQTTDLFTLPERKQDEDFVINGLQNTITLKEVKVRSKLIGAVDFSLRKEKQGKNKCGDYICQYNCLMCPFPDHCRITYIPIKDRIYQRHVVIGGVIVLNPTVVYYGCELEGKPTNIVELNGFLTDKEFYPIDEAMVKTSEPLFQTTIYWTPSLKINKDGNAECSFFSGDVEGTYKIVLQGISNGGLISGEQSFYIDSHK
jgi:hypothetical protein